MIKSPLRYPGGKSRSVEKISACIPYYEEFREAFAGGASVFIYQKQCEPNKSYWINDLYYELFCFWKETALNVEEVKKQILYWREMFSNGRELHVYLATHMQDFNETERAAAFFIFNRITFSGTSESGGYSEQAFAGRFTPSSVQRLNDVAPLLEDVRITNYDYEEVLRAEGDNVFVFLDPPYYSAKKSALYGKNGKLHRMFDHQRFAEAVQKCQHQWLITYDDSPYIRELFSFANIRPCNSVYGMRNVSTTSTQNAKELFITNYDIDCLTSQPQSLLFPELI